jgi:hypothetical protein
VEAKRSDDDIIPKAAADVEHEKLEREELLARLRNSQKGSSWFSVVTRPYSLTT